CPRDRRREPAPARGPRGHRLSPQPGRSAGHARARRLREEPEADVRADAREHRVEVVLLRASGHSRDARIAGRAVSAWTADARGRRAQDADVDSARSRAAERAHARPDVPVHQGDVRGRRSGRERHRLRRRGIAGETVRPPHAPRSPALRPGGHDTARRDSRGHTRSGERDYADRGSRVRLGAGGKDRGPVPDRRRSDRRHRQHDPDRARHAGRSVDPRGGLVNMDRRHFLLGAAAGMTTLTARTARPRAAAAAPTFMYIGSCTQKDVGHGEGLSVYTRRGESDPWTRVQLTNEISDPSFVVIDRAGRFLYSSHGDGMRATSWRIDQATGRVAVVNRQPTGGVNGAHLSIDGTGRFLAVANYATGGLALLRINTHGSLDPVGDGAAMTGTPGPHKTQQERAHPHHCPFDRTGRFIVVPDKGLDRLFLYRLDALKGALVPGEPPSIASRAGAAPRHVDFHPSLPFAYVINELDSTIAVYRFDPEKRELKPLQIVPTLPTTYTGNNTGAEVVVAPSGRFVYGSNRGHDSIAI